MLVKGVPVKLISNVTQFFVIQSCCSLCSPMNLTPVIWVLIPCFLTLSCSIFICHCIWHNSLTHIRANNRRHQMETFSALLAICTGNSPLSGEFAAQRPVTRSFDVFFDLSLNTRLSKQSGGWWFGTPSSPLWRHCNGIMEHKSPLCYCPYSSTAMASTKWPIFCIHFQRHLVERNFSEVCYWEPSRQSVGIGLDNSLVPNGRHVINWNNDDQTPSTNRDLKKNDQN